MREIPQARNFWLEFSGTGIFSVDPKFSESTQNFLGSPNKFAKKCCQILVPMQNQTCSSLSRNTRNDHSVSANCFSSLLKALSAAHVSPHILHTKMHDQSFSNSLKVFCVKCACRITHNICLTHGCCWNRGIKHVIFASLHLCLLEALGQSPLSSGWHGPTSASPRSGVPPKTDIGKSICVINEWLTEWHGASCLQRGEVSHEDADDKIASKR